VLDKIFRLLVRIIFSFLVLGVVSIGVLKNSPSRYAKNKFSDSGVALGFCGGQQKNGRLKVDLQGRFSGQHVVVLIDERLFLDKESVISDEVLDYAFSFEIEDFKKNTLNIVVLVDGNKFQKKIHLNGRKYIAIRREGDGRLIFTVSKTRFVYD
jgi:hypothetical protein